MPFHICEKRHGYVCPVNLEVTSKAPMNWLIAPAFASTGRVVTRAPLEPFSVISIKLSVRKRNLKGYFVPYVRYPYIYSLPCFITSAFRSFLSADCRHGLHLRVTPNRRSPARAARLADSLIEQALFLSRQKPQQVRLLAAVAH